MNSVLLIDNYDSFTYNLAHVFEELGAKVDVIRNDAIDADEAEARAPSQLVISPGPGRPPQSGNTLAIVARLGPTTPTLGVCLGHQAIVETYGGEIGPARTLMHGEGERCRARRPRRVRGAGLSARSRPLSLPRGHERPRFARGHCAERRWRGHGCTPSHAPRCRHPVPPGVGADAARARALSELPEGSVLIASAIELLTRGRSLEREAARATMDGIMTGQATPAQIAAVLIALRMKGETPTELAGFAEGMRAHVLPVHASRPDLIDTAGTGGDGANTFNISTTAALVAASAGAAVAKHGNRAVSSASGSADLLEALGFEVELPAERVAASIDELGFGFMFAPLHHPAMKHAAPVRRELGVRTVFNLLGPLTNPAGARRQLIGVYAPELVPLIASVLAELGGVERALVVHGAGGVDELTTLGPNRACLVEGGNVRNYDVDPASLGFEPGELARSCRRFGAGQRRPHARNSRGRGRAGERHGRAQRSGRSSCCGNGSDARRRLPLGARGDPERRSLGPPCRADRVLERARFGRGARRPGRKASRELMGRFRDALAGPGLVGIAEVKRRSPSMGELRSDADPAALAHAYARAGAAAISILVDAERFGGSWDDLRAARAATDTPLLAKGFFTTSNDVATAREAGADAILLLLRDLDDTTTARLMRESASAGLDAFVEAHDAKELARAIALGADPIGINARNLATFEIERNAQLSLIADARSRGRHARPGGRERHLESRPRRSRRARGCRCDPGGLVTDEGTRSRRQARRAALTGRS